MEVSDIARRVLLAAVNHMHDDHGAAGVVAQEIADHPVVTNTELPQAGQVFAVGYEALFGIVNPGQTPEGLADALLDCVVEPAKLIAGLGTPLNPGRQQPAPSRA